MDQIKTGVFSSLTHRSHLEEAGETYFQHMRCALSFGGRMIGGGFCVLVHAFFPNVLCKKGSSSIERLYQDMIAHRKQYGRRRALPFNR